jgi:glycosyltransferase involved in cell wall biosynthesis
LIVPINICFIVSHLPQGGAERQLLNLILSLDDRRFNTTLILYQNNHIFYSDLLSSNTRLICNSKNFRNKLIKWYHNIRLIRKVTLKNDFDIIHTQLDFNGFWVRILAPRKYNQRIIYSIRSDLRNANPIYLFFEKFLIRRSFVTTNSLNSKTQLLRIVGKSYQKKIVTIYNGIDINKFSALNPPEYNLIIRIGTVGRQSKVKNQMQILNALNLLNKEMNYYFTLIGDKNSESDLDLEDFILRNNLSDSISILSARINIEDYYKKMNIFILASISEGCPNALFEAMLSKCLCIVSIGANSDNYITDGLNGLVYDGSLPMLVEKILQAKYLIESGKHYIIVEAGNNYVKNNFSLDTMKKDYENLYIKIYENSINQ